MAEMDNILYRCLSKSVSIAVKEIKYSNTKFIRHKLSCLIIIELLEKLDTYNGYNYQDNFSHSF